MSYLKALALSGVLLIAADCRQPSTVEQYQLPEEDLSLDPDSLAQHMLLYGCLPDAPRFGWGPGGKPSTEYILADIELFVPGSDGPWEYPRADRLELVRRHGGRVLKVLNLPAARIHIPTSKLPGLVAAVGVARTVPNARRYDWPVAVILNASTTPADLARFEELGGRVRRQFGGNMYSGMIPNRSIPALRNEAAVQFVSPSGTICAL